ncbi:MAG: DUF424 family protein [Thermoplasmatales archaeon]|nr:DUF424 family protein [Thermoplasmatales archaeon]
MTFAIKMHRAGPEMLLAACDVELLGRTFSEGGARITVGRHFYFGEEATAEMLVERMRSATIMNLTGERAVALAVAEGYVDPERTITIQGVIHAQAVRAKCSV